MSAEKTKEETEVTPAMVDAGSRVLANYDPTNWSDEENATVIANAYIAMERCRPHSKTERVPHTKP
jgi:hypothetical protein